MSHHFVSLVPLTPEHKPWLFQLATQSQGSEHWYGEETGDKIPTEKEFFEDFTETYFLDENPEKGRSFAIVLNDQFIGQINYNQVENASTDFDIIIGQEKFMGKGYGGQAITQLIRLLRSNGVSTLSVQVARSNRRAQKAYKKVGFLFYKEKQENGIKWLVFRKSIA